MKKHDWSWLKGGLALLAFSSILMLIVIERFS